jgi:hypothetical protein
MKLLEGSAEARYDWTRYVIRGLHRAGQPDLEVLARTAADELLAASRVVQDRNAAVEDARADRDYDDGILDDLARGVRLKMAAVKPGADKEAPYTRVFPKGIDEFVQAKLGEQVATYERLVGRLTDNLPPTDPLVVVDAPQITSQLAVWSAAADAVDDADRALDAAKGALDAASERWAQTMLGVYGALLGRIGKAKAERLFPKAKSRKATAEAAVEDPPPAPA